MIRSHNDFSIRRRTLRSFQCRMQAKCDKHAAKHQLTTRRDEFGQVCEVHTWDELDELDKFDGFDDFDELDKFDGFEDLDELDKFDGFDDLDELDSLIVPDDWQLGDTRGRVGRGTVGCG